MSKEPLFPRNLRGIMKDGKDSYDLLPSHIKEMHNVNSKIIAQGNATISRDHRAAARLAAWIFRFPKEGKDIPVTTTFSTSTSGETLHRNFNGECFSTYFYDHPEEGHFLERFGPFWFLIKGDCSKSGIIMSIRTLRLWNLIPLPLWLAPHIDASESVNNDCYHFDVSISFPLIGNVIRYKGDLSITQRI